MLKLSMRSGTAPGDVLIAVAERNFNPYFNLALKTIGALLFCVASGLSVRGQVSFVETFDDNSRNWTVGSRADGVTAVISDGVYRIRRDADRGGFLDVKPVSLKEDDDWSVRLKIRQTEGSDTDMFGLVLGYTDNANMQLALVNSYDQMELTGYYSGRSLPVVQKTAAPFRLPMTKWVTIEVRKQSDAAAMFLNGTVVHSWGYKDARLLGDGFGIIVSGRMTVEVDEIHVNVIAQPPIKLVAGADKKSERINLGDAVNSQASEVVDAIAADDRTIYVSRRYHPGNTFPFDQSDLWVSERDKSGAWGPLKNMGRPVNNQGHNFAFAVSPDGNTLLMGNQYLRNGMPGGNGASISHRTRTGWSLPTDVVIESFQNKNRFVSFCLGPDGQTLLMGVERDGGYGEQDLYVSFLKDDGTWSAPVNLGPDINTFGTEATPYLAPDNVTMYFATNARPGYGGLDVFVTRRIDSTWQRWTEPENLGPSINTDGFEAHFKVPARGDTAYMVSSTNSYGREDVFKIALPTGARPEPVILVRGTVTDKATGKPLEATVVYEDLSTGVQAGIGRTSPVDGSFTIALPAGRRYGFRAESSGYYAASENLDLRKSRTFREVEHNLEMSAIAANTDIRLNNVFFATGKATLEPESYGELNRLVSFLEKNSSVAIELRGHTDNIGKATANIKLSQDRVASVQTYLQEKGVSPTRLQSRGFGATMPVASNATEEGRSRNRRVEFRIVRR